MASINTLDDPMNILASCGVDPERGFLPARDPLARLPAAFDCWEEIAQDLRKWLAVGHVRQVLDRIPVLDADLLEDEAQYQRAMLLLSYFGHAYVWGGTTPAQRLPASVAVPWYAVAQRLGRPPVLSYASSALCNWRRLDPSGPIALGNIVLLQNFLGGMDEEWFLSVHVAIEATAAAAIKAILPAQQTAAQGQLEALTQHLTIIGAAIEQMCATFLRISERADPYIFYNRLRPFIHGWKDNPALPDGLIYEGVAAYGGQPQHFRGETAAQSSTIPVLDAGLGITHRDDPMRIYLMEMRQYMPPMHRALIETIEQGPSIRQVVCDHAHQQPALREAYNRCVNGIKVFRSKHLGYTSRYIIRQGQKDLPTTNSADIGTGGTPFLPYLKKHHDETAEHHIP